MTCMTHPALQDHAHSIAMALDIITAWQHHRLETAAVSATCRSKAQIGSSGLLNVDLGAGFSTIQ